MRINIGDLVKLRQNINDSLAIGCVGTIEDIFFKNNKTYCTIYWTKKNFKSTVPTNYVVKIIPKTETTFKSIW